MKKYNFTKKALVIILLLPMLFSCEEWLDVQPKTKIKSENVFEKPVYFKQALIGVYIKLASQSLYGQELSFCFMDALNDMYDFNDNNAKYYYAAQRDYTNSQNSSIISNIWQNAYNAVANINNIIENVETQIILDDVTADLIEGEARGLRAFIHFDLLRMFGPGNLANNSVGLNTKSIPYVTKYERFLSPQLTTSEVLTQIHSDLDKAIELLKTGDKWGEDFPIDYEGDDFVENDRKYRFNYWAAIAAKARVYLWEGDYENALLYAEIFIKNSDEEIQFVTENDINNGDLVFTNEIIFGLNIHDLYNSSSIHTYFEQNDFGYTTDLMFIEKDKYDAIFERNGVGQPDLRHNKFADYDYDKITLHMYHQEGNTATSFNNKVAIIRKPEMYYIAAESLYKLEIRESDALTYLNTVRTSRHITTPITESDDFNLEIEKEYFKDMFGEGQIFYFLKRLGYLTMPYSDKTIDPLSLIIPLPQSELNFGRE